MEKPLFKCPSVIVEPNGSTQTFSTTNDNPISLEGIEQNLNILPMMILLKGKDSIGKAETYFTTYLSLEKKESVQLQNELSNLQTQVELESNDYVIRVSKQILEKSGKRFDVLGEIYGNDNTNEQNDSCVVCISDKPEIAILPCRHMCLCSACATILRQQSNKCPICRTQMETLVKIPNEEHPNQEEKSIN